MTSDDLTPQQAATLAAWLSPATMKLATLNQRLQARGFPPADPLYQRAAAAYEAVRQLRLLVRSRETVPGLTGVVPRPKSAAHAPPI